MSKEIYEKEINVAWKKIKKHKNINQIQRKHFDNHEAVTFSIHGLVTEILEYTPGKVFSSWQGLAPQAVTPILKCIHGDICVLIVTLRIVNG